jgi:hypothetical protein
MPRVTWTRRLLVLVLVAAVTGCASRYQPPPPRQSTAPRTRCLTDPNETGSRPLLFFFCVESP